MGWGYREGGVGDREGGVGDGGVGRCIRLSLEKEQRACLDGTGGEGEEGTGIRSWE